MDSAIGEIIRQISKMGKSEKPHKMGISSKKLL